MLLTHGNARLWCLSFSGISSTNNDEWMVVVHWLKYDLTILLKTLLSFLLLVMARTKRWQNFHLPPTLSLNYTKRIMEKSSEACQKKVNNCFKMTVNTREILIQKSNIGFGRKLWLNLESFYFERHIFWC